MRIAPSMTSNVIIIAKHKRSVNNLSQNNQINSLQTVIFSRSFSDVIT